MKFVVFYCYIIYPPTDSARSIHVQQNVPVLHTKISDDQITIFLNYIVLVLHYSQCLIGSP